MKGGGIMFNQRPRIEIISKAEFEHLRARELAKTIFSYLDFGNTEYELIQKRTDELSERISNLRYMEEEQ